MRLTREGLPRTAARRYSRARLAVARARCMLVLRIRLPRGGSPASAPVARLDRPKHPEELMYELLA